MDFHLAFQIPLPALTPQQLSNYSSQQLVHSHRWYMYQLGSNAQDISSFTLFPLLCTVYYTFPSQFEVEQRLDLESFPSEYKLVQPFDQANWCKDVNKYNISIFFSFAAYVYSVGHATVTKDPIIVSDPGCATIYEIPPNPSLVDENIPAAVPYRGGVMMVGISSTHGLANYWLPGEEEWSNTMGFSSKREGIAVSLRGNMEVVAMMSRRDGIINRAVTYYDGTNIEKNQWDYIPEKTFKAAMVEGC